MTIESNHDHFDLSIFLEARRQALHLLDEFQAWVKDGVTEKEGSDFLDQRGYELGFDKKWHPNKVRFGPNTTKSFREPSEEKIVYDSQDIAFVDIGFIYHGHENDIGRTFIKNKSDKNQKLVHIQESVVEVFRKTKEAWIQEDINGKDLYSFASQTARELGYELNLKMAGHRLGSFPHAIHFKGKLEEIDFVPHPNLWILEILIYDSKTNRGAFFEDLLSRNLNLNLQ